MLLEGLSQMLLRVLRIPPGTSWRKPNASDSSSSPVTNEYVLAMVDITVDDICIGEEPLSLDCDTTTPEEFKEKFNQICRECNSIIKWAAKDLCLYGYSIYEERINKRNQLALIPYNKPVEFFLTKDKEVVVYESHEYSGSERKQLKDMLVFLNYEKSSLNEIEDDKDKKFAYSITPCPMQLKNAQNAINNLNNAENAIMRYRVMASRVARWVNVDIGLSQGDKQQAVVDTIASAINANSMSLSTTSEAGEFDDNIPVLPNRKGIGKPEIAESKMDVNIKDLADLDYHLGKLNLIMRFPGSYIDYSKELNSTAVSTIRGDIRYAKMCKAVGTKLVSTLNDFIEGSKQFKKFHPAFMLTTLPTPEDEDVIAALDQYSDLTEKVYNFVIGDDPEESSQAKLNRLEMLQNLFAGSAMSPAIQSWFETLAEQIKRQVQEGSPDESPDGGSNIDIDVDSEEGSEVNLEGIKNEPEPLEGEPQGPEDVEFLEPQSEASEGV